MKNFVQNGDIIHVVISGSAVVSGQVLKIGNVIGVATKDGAIGDTVAFSVSGVYSLVKVTTDVVTQGALMYWDDTAKKVTITATSNTLVGPAWEAAGNGVTTVATHLAYAE